MTRQMLLALCACFLCAVGACAGDTRTKILLIGKDRDHAYATHTYMDDCELLARCLRQTTGVETVVSNGWPKDPEVPKDVSAIVLQTKLGGTMLLRGPQRRQVQDLMRKGVGLTAIHWSTGAEKSEGEEYLHMLGGWFNTDFSEYHEQQSKVRQADPKHPISRGWQDFDLREEYYIKLRYLPESKPIMKAAVKDKSGQTQDYDIAWVYERPGGGRSFGFVGGHFHANFGEKAFRQAVVNGILWTAKLEVPEDGAPCAITPKDMELAPDAPKKK
jgi:type 1 glutamine amidotransferase